MKKQLVSIAIVSSLLAGSHNALANGHDEDDSKSKQYISTGIGAVAGAIFAGPVGFLAGGLLGNLAGKHDAISSAASIQPSIATELHTPASIQPHPEQASENTDVDTIIVAQAGEVESLINDDLESTTNLKDLLVTGLNMDVFFLSGSTEVENFYHPRLKTLAMFMQEMDDVDIYLDGYSDRRGDSASNLALSNRRLEAVRNELLQAGVDEKRIHINAHGEQQFISKPGDLEAYTFDRRVVVRFGESAATSNRSVAQVEQTPAI